MASDHRSAADIEREIEEERSALARTLDEIHDRLSFESLSNDLMGRVRDGSGDIGRSIVRTARENPIPVALTAVGLAWLLAGRGFGRSDAAEADPYARAASIPASARWADENRRDRDFPAGPRNLWGSARGVYSDARDTAREAAESTRETGRAAAEGVREAASGLGEAAREAWRSGRDQLASGTRSAREHLREGVDAAGDAAEAGASSARHYVRGAGKALRRGAHDAYASAAELRDRISEGTEDRSRPLPRRRCRCGRRGSAR